MWDSPTPLAARLTARYHVHSTQPSLCADELLAGRADLGLIPIASLTPSLAIVSNCAIASLDRVRSIQLIIKPRQPQTVGAPQPGSPASAVARRGGRLDFEMWEKRDSNPAFIDRALAAVRTVAADTASRSSLTYAQVLFPSHPHRSRIYPRARRSHRHALPRRRRPAHRRSRARRPRIPRPHRSRRRPLPLARSRSSMDKSNPPPLGSRSLGRSPRSPPRNIE